MNQGGFSWKSLWKDLGTRRWIFLLAAGLLFVVIALPMEPGGDGGGSGEIQGTAAAGEEISLSEYEKKLERRLAALLSAVEGAGKVEVMVTLRSSSEQIVLNDVSREENLTRETDAQGGVRNNSDIRESSQTVLSGTNGRSEPYVLGERMPQVEGVVVACEGGDRASVQAEISAAVQALFDLEPHKIKVCKMASQ